MFGKNAQKKTFPRKKKKFLAKNTPRRNKKQVLAKKEKDLIFKQTFKAKLTLQHKDVLVRKGFAGNKAITLSADSSAEEQVSYIRMPKGCLNHLAVLFTKKKNSYTVFNSK